jgi:inhibitor of KinA
MEHWPGYKSFGDSAVLVEWQEVIDEETHDEVLRFNKFISENYANDFIETVIAYQSVTIYLNAEIDVNEFISSVKVAFVKWNSDMLDSSLDAKSIISIPVCYEQDYALDISRVANRNDISIEEVIALHTKTPYKIYFTGFLPGFPYLGGLNRKLHTPRLNAARTLVSKGSIGIGGTQTGVYSVESPGGWNIIGRTPISCFSIKETPPTIFESGHYVNFRSISFAEYKALEKSIQKGEYQLEIEPYND